MRNLLINTNPTMPSCVGIFNLPPLLTCTPSRWCRKYCYALKNRFVWNSVVKSLNWRYEESKESDFVEKMLCELKRRKSIKYVRIHIAGDFYSKEYVDKWAVIAKSRSDLLFRTNTKRLDLLTYMKKVFPKNVVVRESIDSTRKSKKILPVVAIEGTQGSKKFFQCVNNCEKCEFYCWHQPNISIVLNKL